MGIKTRLTKMKKGMVNALKCSKFKKDKSTTEGVESESETRELMTEQGEQQEQPVPRKRRFLVCGLRKKHKKKSVVDPSADAVTEEARMTESRMTESRVTESRVTESTESTEVTALAEVTGSTVATKSTVGTNKSTNEEEETKEVMTDDEPILPAKEPIHTDIEKAVKEVLTLYEAINYNYCDNINLLEKLLNYKMNSSQGKQKADDFLESIRPLLNSLFAVTRECSTLFFKLNSNVNSTKEQAIENFKLFFTRAILGEQDITNEHSSTHHQEKVFLELLLTKLREIPSPTISVASPETTPCRGNSAIQKVGSSSTNPAR